MNVRWWTAAGIIFLFWLTACNEEKSPFFGLFMDNQLPRLSLDDKIIMIQWVNIVSSSTGFKDEESNCLLLTE